MVSGAIHQQGGLSLCPSRLCGAIESEPTASFRLSAEVFQPATGPCQPQRRKQQNTKLQKGIYTDSRRTAPHRIMGHRIMILCPMIL